MSGQYLLTFVAGVQIGVVDYGYEVVIVVEALPELAEDSERGVVVGVAEGRLELVLNELADVASSVAAGEHLAG